MKDYNSVFLCFTKNELSHNEQFFLEKNFLSYDEMTKSAAINDDLQRFTFMQAHGFLKKILASFTKLNPSEIRFFNNAYGKPFLSRQKQKPELFFNLSHTMGLTALIVSNNAYSGIDVEKIEIRNDFDLLQKAIFNNKEVEAAAHLSAPALLKENFFRIWVIKECLLKAIGRGFSLEPSDIWTEELNAGIYKIAIARLQNDWPLISYIQFQDYALAFTLHDRAEVSMYEYTFDGDFYLKQ